MMTFEQIRQIIAGHMETWAGLPADCIDYPNAPTVFDPSGKKIWARLNNIPTVSSVSEIGSRVCIRRTGNIVIQLFAPVHSGVKALSEAASTIADHFEYYSESNLVFTTANLDDLGPDENGYYQINVTIGYTTV
ncbi:hypothetical protein LMG33818_000888 [Halomonadaceae bacterium LMG 33818]|uniref:phage tail terminator-like protein n=1 Tax=Cernens ardua TaxID=3402176 RepID=UPI003EDBCC0A